MKLRFFSAFVVSGTLIAFAATRAGNDPIVEATRKIAREIQTNGKAHSDLKELTDLGPRLCGSPGAAKAVEWAKRKLESYGLDRVELQPVMVPQWTRGEIEKASIISTAHPISLNLTTLGGSVGTGAEGIEAPVVEVQSLEEVASLGAKVKGKIVFYNRPMDPGLSDTFEAYGKAVDQRVKGASAAAKWGAVAVLVRSLTTLPDDDHPHTGVVHYEPGIAQIPAAALSTHSANELSRWLRKDPELAVELELSAALHPNVLSYNVIGEIKGRDLPQEYVVVGGHLDAWDLANGAHDDGAGVTQSIEVLRSFRALGIRPRRTVRTVLFMAEEISGDGGREYKNQAEKKGEKHVAALESDSGGFAPVGFEVQASDAIFEAVKGWGAYLSPLHAGLIQKGGSGADVAPLTQIGAAAFGLTPVSTHYFDYHHSELDHFDAVDREELHAGAAAMAAFVYLAAEKGFE